MVYELAVLAFSMIDRGYINKENAASLLHDVNYVASNEDPFFDGKEARLKTAKLLYVWASKESAGIVNIKGDKGASIGIMQFRKEWLNKFNVKEEDVLKDARVALKLGLDIMKSLKCSCKTTKGALMAYASGSCIGNMRSKKIVEERCKLIGGC
jgi:hypothetical protein